MPREGAALSSRRWTLAPVPRAILGAPAHADAAPTRRRSTTSHPVHVRNEGAKKRKKARGLALAPGPCLPPSGGAADRGAAAQAPPPPPEPRIFVKDKAAAKAAVKQDAEAKAARRAQPDKAAPAKPACVCAHPPPLLCSVVNPALLSWLLCLSTAQTLR